MEEKSLKVIFLHPDLGIGGAERLVVDAALALKSFGHSVQFLTSHHDKKYCFEETGENGSLDVVTVGDFLPRHLFGLFHALFAYLRSMFAAIYLLWFSNWRDADLIFVDQISAPILLLRHFSKCKIIFYCHFPDQLLTKRTGFLKKMYRTPIDALEEYTTGLAHCVLVNSNFTAETFRKTFKSLKDTHLEIIYPCISETLVEKTNETEKTDFALLKETWPAIKPNFFLSLNRYERKKNIALAIQALGVLQSKLTEEDFHQVHLVVAGGYDPVNNENIDHFAELTCLTDNLGLERHVTFLKSPKDDIKACLLSNCLCLIYTPSFEHFGIVPVEAMLFRRPVLAVNNGGPLETVVNNETGFLVEADSEKFAGVLKRLVSDKNLATKMGSSGRERALRLFSFDVFAEKLNAVCIAVFSSSI